MKLKCVNFLNPVTIGSTPKTYLIDTNYDIELNGNYVEITAKRERDKDANGNDGPLCSCVATIYNVVYFKMSDQQEEMFDGLKKRVEKQIVQMMTPSGSDAIQVELNAMKKRVEPQAKPVI